VAIDIRSLSRVIDYPYADMTITVEAGITAAALRAVLAEHGQRLQVDIPRPDQVTLGGVFATNASGPRRFGLGRPRDQIIGISFVTSAGVSVKGGGRVVKNVAGYDFPRLLTGSLGTLGIITQMTLKVRPIPETSAIVWIPLTSGESAALALDQLNTSDSRPVAVELLNATAARMIGQPLDLPATDWVLAIGVEDNASSAKWQIDRLKQEVPAPDLVVGEADDAMNLWTGLIEFQELAQGPINCVVSVRPSAVVEYTAQADTGRWAVQCHAGNGFIRLHSLGEWTEAQAASEISRLRALALRFDGSLILTRCPTAWKSRLKVWGDPRPDWALALRVKRALDPKGAMNPGRFVGGI
jgi:glycolate oxidase FAD binding subunit